MHRDFAMGLVDDFFGGGAEISPLPPELQQIAGRDTALNKLLFGGAQDGIADAYKHAPGVQQNFMKALSMLNPAGQFASQHFNDSKQQYNSLWNPALDKTGSELLAAGSPERQAEEAARARSMVESESDAALSRLRRQQARHGYGPGGGADTPMMRLQIAANSAGAANRARYAERDRGEAIRRQMFPTLFQAGDTTTQRGLQPSAIAEMQAKFGQNAATTLPGLIQPNLAVGQHAGAHGQSAYNKHNDIWNMNNSIAQANSKRKGNWLEAGLNVGGAFLGLPGAGSILRGGSSGGGGHFPDFSGQIGALFGGGGGATLPSNRQPGGGRIPIGFN